MTRFFIDRVFNERLVDTRKYRYLTDIRFIDGSWQCCLIRLPLSLLYTVEALNPDNWEVIKDYAFQQNKKA